MKRLLIPFVAAFGLSLGIATGVRIMRAPKASAAAANVVARTNSLNVKAADTSSTKEPAPSNAPDSPANGAGVASVAAANATPSATPSVMPPVMPPAAGAPTASGGTPAHAVSKSAESTNVGVATAPIAAPVPVKLATTQPKTTADSGVSHRLAKVFAAMQAKDAARVLEQMEDSDVQVILTSLSNKQQAAILGSFPTQRAATIMRSTLRNSAGGAQ